MIKNLILEKILIRTFIKETKTLIDINSQSFIKGVYRLNNKQKLNSKI